jgi:hypothetical protein
MENRAVPISLSWYWSKPSGNEYLMYIMPVWMQDITRKDVNDKDVRAWVENQLIVDLAKGFISIKSANYGEVVVAFNCDKWLEANFLKDPKVFFEIPRTLVWYFRYLLPATLTSHVESNFIEQFLVVRFKNFLKSHHKSIFAEKMKLMKKVNMDWFTYDVDLQMNKITIMLKATVLLTLMIGAKVAKNILGTNKDPWS